MLIWCVVGKELAVRLFTALYFLVFLFRRWTRGQNRVDASKNGIVGGHKHLLTLPPRASRLFIYLFNYLFIYFATPQI